MKRRWVKTAGVVCLAAFGVLWPQSLRDDWPLGSEISFSGPVVRVDREERGEDAVRLLIQVNQSHQWVALTSWTQVTAGLGFPSSRRSLVPGDFVEVTGHFTRFYPPRESTPEITIYAKRIHRENASDLEMEGPIQAFGEQSVKVRGIAFRITETSDIRSSGAPEAETLGFPPPSGTLARLRARWKGGFPTIVELEYGPRTVESATLRLEGTLQSVENSPVGGSAFVWVETGVKVGPLGSVAALVELTRKTRVEGELPKGSLVAVEGRFAPGQAYVQAERIASDDNGNGNPFDDMERIETTPVWTELFGKVERFQHAGQARGTFSVFQTGVTYTEDTVFYQCSEDQPVGPEGLAEGVMVLVEGGPAPKSLSGESTEGLLA
ncbi:MAG TPA: DUF5666 domain-containing protein, partial [Acidobacteriota bacterium]|nr:DUF5666 domain-containing protein [Acidobacteriota bacterium]